PSPLTEKDAHRAAPSNQTFTQAAAPFNHDRIGWSPSRTLSLDVVAQMTRFGLTPKVLINH
ncbi:hypothetical protein, partial [Mesorhizobium sp. M2E.F.Ca.ET.154.01.1.1]|uniref:hypothetical protein n=1 Tax=Mesorhizobium sp. M2E.F.Ca.ET.154.01.1.1 TaxID=2500521 RepID=UPI001AEDF202